MPINIPNPAAQKQKAQHVPPVYPPKLPAATWSTKSQHANDAEYQTQIILWTISKKKPIINQQTWSSPRPILFPHSSQKFLYYSLTVQPYQPKRRYKMHLHNLLAFKGSPSNTISTENKSEAFLGNTKPTPAPSHLIPRIQDNGQCRRIWSKCSSAFLHNTNQFGEGQCHGLLLCNKITSIHLTVSKKPREKGLSKVKAVKARKKEHEDRSPTFPLRDANPIVPQMCRNHRLKDAKLWKSEEERSNGSFFTRRSTIHTRK